MGSVNGERKVGCHVVAMPYPGRGHINPMMNLCKLLSSRSDDILITFVVTEEWLSLIGSESKPANIRLVSIPNVVPSELVRAADLLGFLDAVWTKMEAPFERLLDRLEPPVTVIIADTLLSWAVGVGNRRNIPVASLWPMSATVFSIIYYLGVLAQNRTLPVDLSDMYAELANYIPGFSSTRMADLLRVWLGNGGKVLQEFVKIISTVSSDAQYLLLTSIYEPEAQVIDALREKFPLPVYPTGSVIPYFKLADNSFVTTNHNDLSYLQWLNSQPINSVLYISFGSYLSVSSAQMEEIVAGLHDSGVRYLWVAREETSRLKEVCGVTGFVLPWCDQWRVLSHSSVGGFWTHCGWNSTFEGVLAGVPLLTFPIGGEQIPNSKQIVEDWKIGWRLKREVKPEVLVKREEIAALVQRFMDLESNEGKEIRERGRELREICQRATQKGGSSEAYLKAFIHGISKRPDH